MRLTKTTALGLAAVLAGGAAAIVAVNGSDSSQAATQSTAAPAAQAAQVAARAITCSTATGGKPFYDGPSASKVYDARFGKSAAVASLGTHTPQGLGTWFNWDGKKNLLLVVSYRKGARSQIIGIDPATNKTAGVVAIDATHGGGITTSNGWAFVQGSTNGIRKYKLSTLKTAMKAAGTPYIKPVGAERKVYGASFLTSYGGYVWSGKFNDKGRDKMYQYKINSNGSLTTVKKAWEIPTKTQGLLVTGTHFVFSTSYGRDKRSNLYVVRRGQPDLDKARLSCFRAPSMSEGITEFGGRAYLLFESGAHLYRGDSRTLNVISHLHKATISSLTKLA
ncbi:hypothetical protein [Kribbella sp. CA-293567]|uniref:hypothetical protein n=1 Tax=Kribbella sp. CA-293567 TaxID=3002436 RepID=UPI0022DDA982|nr:hypothetical protein [Kribbella sp. CA-293567]WBQ03667.1 hypothetical protein OX958_27300 [Kribbella sp. CA-293567]